MDNQELLQAFKSMLQEEINPINLRLGKIESRIENIKMIQK